MIAVKKRLEGVSLDSPGKKEPETFSSIDKVRPLSPTSTSNTSALTVDSRSSLPKRRVLPRSFTSLDVGSFDDRASSVEENKEKIVSPYVEKIHSIRSTRKPITNYNASYEIKNKEGEICKIQHIMTEQKMCVQGRFSEVFVPTSDSAQVCEDVLNSEIVIKILRDDKLRSTSACPSSAEEKIDLALNQFKCLAEYFKNKKEKHPPIVMIYNPDTAKDCGYTVVQKVKPLDAPLWTKDTKVSALSTEQKRHYNTLVKLLEANQVLKDTKMSEMDLKQDNLGIDGQGNLVLLDYVNTPFLSNDFDDTAERRLSMGNQEIKNKLEAREELL